MSLMFGGWCSLFGTASEACSNPKTCVDVLAVLALIIRFSASANFDSIYPSAISSSRLYCGWG
jgi:hypothetical protein